MSKADAKNPLFRAIDASCPVDNGYEISYRQVCFGFDRAVLKSLAIAAFSHNCCGGLLRSSNWLVCRYVTQACCQTCFARASQNLRCHHRTSRSGEPAIRALRFSLGLEQTRKGFAHKRWALPICNMRLRNHAIGGAQLDFAVNAKTTEDRAKGVTVCRAAKQTPEISRWCWSSCTVTRDA